MDRTLTTMESPTQSRPLSALTPTIHIPLTMVSWMEIANSPNVGICLCCGTWLEGGRQLTGKDPEEMIRYFGAQKIWKIHFRNVSAPLPHFVETFMDNGYYDMNKVMKALRDVNFDGIVILDHTPTLAGGANAQTAYGFAYMKALLNRANAEAKG